MPPDVCTIAQAASQHDHAGLDAQQCATLAQRDTFSGLASSCEGAARLGGGTRLGGDVAKRVERTF